MTISDDFGLTRLFRPRPIGTSVASPLGATMTEWNAVTGDNVVMIGSTVYRNLPVLSPNGLTTGPVMVQKTSGGWVVLGMIARSGDPVPDPIRYRSLRTDISLPDTTLIDAGLLNFLLKADTEYGLEGRLFYSSTTSNDIRFAWTGPPNMAVKWGMAGLNNASTFSVVPTILTTYGNAAPQTLQGAGFGVQCWPGGWFKTTDTGGPLQLRVALDSGTTAGQLMSGSWLRLTELGLGSGAQTYLKQYTATASRSYDDSGDPIGSPDQDDNIYAGSFPDRAFGNERSILIFPGSTIRADLTGATVLTARLWLYCFKAEETNGSLVEPTTRGDTSVPATLVVSADSPDTGLHDAWPVPGWFSVECLVKGGARSLLNGIVAGDDAVVLPPVLFGLAATGFRGFGFGSTYRPYLEVTYAI